MEWELSKENVQPMKSGRNVEVLNDALKAKVEGHARVNIFETQRRQMLDAIENYAGDDPLQPWIRCIKWVKDAFPAGGAQSELLKLLEGCTRQFHKDELYRNDVRYLRVWVQYADCCTDPSDVFAFLEANEIGQTFALFYEAYATSMEVRRNFKKADEIYRLGISRHAQPLGRLENMYKNFLSRMVRRGERKIREEQQQISSGSFSENEAPFRAFGPTSHFSGTSEQHYFRERGRQSLMQPPHPRGNKPKTAKLSIFVDPEFESSRNNSTQDLPGEDPGLSSNQSAAWWHLPAEADRIKENVQQPTKWTDAKIKQKHPFSQGQQSGLEVYVDEQFSEVNSLRDHSKPGKPAPPPILKLRLEDMQSMKRTSPRLKGSFLDFASAAVGSASNSVESPGVLAVQEACNLPKPHLPSVLAYDTHMINENGEEKSFEEVRLKLWREFHKGLMDLDQVDNLEVPREEESLQFLSGAQDSDRPVQSEGQVTIKSSPCTSIPSTPMLVETDTDTVQSVRDSSPKNGDIILDDEKCPGGSDRLDYLVDPPANGSATTGMNSTIVSEQRTEEGYSQLEGSSGRLSRASTSFSMQGDETIAIKRFADEIIVLGTDPRVNSIDTGSHHGLVDPTINTKECVADILDMFNKPLESDNLRSKSRVSKDSKKRTSKSGGFQIFVDDDLQVERHMEPCKNEKRVKCPSSKFSVAGENKLSGFQVYMDEDLGGKRPVSFKGNAKSSINLSKKSEPESGKFQIYEDENFAVQPARPKQSQRKTVSKLSTIQSKDFQVFVDDEFCDLTPGQNGKCGENQKLSDENAENWKIVDNEDMIDKRLKAKSVEKRATKSTSRSSIDLGVCVDEEFRDLSLSSRLSEEQGFDICPEKYLDSSRAKENAGEIYQVEEASITVEGSSPVLAGICLDQVLERETAAQLKTSERLGSTAINSLCVTNIAETVPITPAVHVEEEEDSDAAPSLENVDPWDESTIKGLLSRIHSSLSNYEGFFESETKYSGPLPTSSLRASNGRNKDIHLGNNTYRLTGCIGEGAFAHVFEAEDADDDFFDDPPKVALKFQKPACPWEFYIYRQLDRRISEEDRRYFGKARRMHLYTNCSFLICDHGDKGTLQDVVNAYLAEHLHMEEAMCMFYTIELLRMLEVLHSVGIIHGDIKPDNFLMRDIDDSIKVEDWAPDHPGCWKSQGLCLIDWGRSIDTTLFPDGTEFLGDCKTDSFRCPEMLERRPWTFQVDTFGLCGVVHCLLHQSYMQVEKVKTADGQCLYRPKAAFKRYWNVKLWKELFDNLLNVKDFYDREVLIRLRKSFENHLVENNMGKKLKGFVRKQNIMIFESRRR
ncbi:checkpoint serine/threonine-protein kinase [Marchantia polymorpha subsp. ruderalis]|uniref:BUB1 N-terminal domain-containing protein n=2 Tax=Marchantia polymorpha TaxID=3197 RepID=A0AAF6BZ99_MARPO|nr:hypothetical protein MARPO_0009s0056 [Marchantia polymorpha]BBN17333.1 hypothetical protein Mp_7g13710 [Marchantia polymorpha subsp. ruderalis]|eukprot:PTQ46937.1 hypothetical protein MARPO_0009s0056 [Marchantia polymorpha]